METDLPAFSIYLLRCRDGSLYTGIATDVARRILEHAESPKGARYLRGKGPLTLVYQREIGGRSLATKVENWVKQLPRHEKGDPDRLPQRVDEILVELESR